MDDPPNSPANSPVAPDPPAAGPIAEPPDDRRKKLALQGLPRWARLGSNQRPLACEAMAPMGEGGSPGNAGTAGDQVWRAGDRTRRRRNHHHPAALRGPLHRSETTRRDYAGPGRNAGSRGFRWCTRGSVPNRASSVASTEPSSSFVSITRSGTRTCCCRSASSARTPISPEKFALSAGNRRPDSRLARSRQR